MSELLKIVLLLLTLGLFSSSYASNSVNLLIMIEDADKTAISRDNRINKRVHASISQQLNHIANVYDETSITLNHFKQGRVRRTDAELLDIARSVTRPPIDVVVVFSTYATVNANEYSKKARARVEGRLLDAKSGRFLDNFEVQSPNGWAIPYACNLHTCMLEEIGDEAKVLGDELGLILAEKLNWLFNANVSDTGSVSPVAIFNDYYLEFDGFSAQDVASIEEYLLIASSASRVLFSIMPVENKRIFTNLIGSPELASAIIPVMVY